MKKNNHLVFIERNTNGDSRVAKRVPTIEEFDHSNRSHVNDVQSLMGICSDELLYRGNNHDYTKINEPGRSMFYRDLCDTIEGKMNFDDGAWSKLHYQEERHHLTRHVPDDVDLFDIFEMICDCVCAGMARSGKVRVIELPDDDCLHKAIDNTVKYLLDSVKIIGEEEEK